MHNVVQAQESAAAPATAAVPVVGIGASAGGLEALREMLAPARLPTGLAFVVVQHLDPNHESMLAELLDRTTGLRVLQCAGGERIAADTVHIIPPGHGLAIREGRLELTDFQQPRGLRRPRRFLPVARRRPAGQCRLRDSVGHRRGWHHRPARHQGEWRRLPGPAAGKRAL